MLLLFHTKLIRPAVKVLDASNGTVEACVSDESEDGDGDVVRQAGWNLQRFDKHPVLVSSHDYSNLLSQIGEWQDMGVRDGKLIGTARYYIDKGNPQADWAFQLAQEGKAAYSVGFIPRDYQARKAGGYEFRAQDLLEVSQVVVPSNENGLQLMAKRLGLAKWPMDPGGWDEHCVVAGCDDAACIYPPVCQEHLKHLVNAPAEPAGAADGDGAGDGEPQTLAHRLRRITEHRTRQEAS